MLYSSVQTMQRANLLRSIIVAAANTPPLPQPGGARAHVTDIHCSQGGRIPIRTFTARGNDALQETIANRPESWTHVTQSLQSCT